MEKQDNLKTRPHWRCRLCQHRSPPDAAICENPSCGADLAIYGEMILPGSTEDPPVQEHEKKKRGRNIWEEETDGGTKPPRRRARKGQMAVVLAVFLLAGVGIGWSLQQGGPADQEQPSGTEEPVDTEPAPEPAAPEEPLPEETPAPDLSWENNILREDPAPDSPDAAESPVFGTELRRNDVGTVTFLSSLSEMPQESWDVSAEEDGSVMAWAEYDDSSGLYDLYIGAEGGVAAPEDCSRMFCYYEQLREISFNGAFHTDRVTTMEAMFGYCYELTGCDLSGMSAPEVTSMEDMFYNCENLTEVSTRGMSCASLLDTSTMFWQCHGLREVDISGLATENVEDMSGMFGHCTSLETLDVSFFNTSRVTNMETMFAACKNLTAVDVGAFDTSSAELVDRMFFGCTNLAMPDFSGWDLSNVTSFEEFAEGTEFSFMILMFDHSGI